MQRVAVSENMQNHAAALAGMSLPLAAQKLPTVATVILNWNGWADTLDCLHSLLAMEYKNQQVIVVDNGSSDDSVIRIRSAFPAVEIVETGSNLGFAGGCNVGIARAIECNAGYVWLINNDTIVDSHTLSAMIAVADEDARIGAVGSVIYYHDEPGCIQAWGGGRVDLWLGRIRHVTSPAPFDKLHYITGTSLLIRTAAIRDVGVLDSSFFMYWEDTEFSFRLRKAGWRLAVAPESKIWHKESRSAGRGGWRDSLLTSSQIRFLAQHARFPLFTIFAALAGKVSKSLLTADWQRLRAIWDGILAGIRSHRTTRMP